jgi:hypothetical protein
VRSEELAVHVVVGILDNEEAMEGEGEVDKES